MPHLFPYNPFDANYTNLIDADKIDYMLPGSNGRTLIYMIDGEVLVSSETLGVLMIRMGRA